MAVVVGNGQVKLDDGSIVAAQQGAWYDGQQYWGGTLSNKGQINSLSNQQGAGKQVSAEVNRQSSVAQGKAPDAIQNYLYGSSGYTPGGVDGGSGLGAGAAFSGMSGGGQSSLNLEELYSNLMNSEEMKAIQSEVDAANAKLTQRRAENAEAEALINDNPWYSEATRVGKIGKQREKFTADEQNILNEVALAQDKLAKARAEAETRLNISMKQYDINRQEYQDNLTRFNMLLESGALDGASGADIASISTATGISPSMIDSILKAQKAKNVSPQVITSTDDSGRVTFTVVDALTGNIINQQDLGRIGKADGSGSTMKFGSAEYTATSRQGIHSGLTAAKNSYGHVSPTIFNQALNAYLADGLGSASDFYNEYANLTDPYRSDFESAYGFSKAQRNKIVSGR